MFDKMFAKKQEKVQVEKSIEKKIEENGGMSEEQLKIEQKKEVEARMTKWTPRQQAALNFLRVLPAYREILQDERLSIKKLDLVERFAKNPTDIIRSAKYNEKTNKFEASGKVAGSSSAVA